MSLSVAKLDRYALEIPPLSHEGTRKGVPLAPSAERNGEECSRTRTCAQVTETELDRVKDLASGQGEEGRRHVHVP